MRHVQYNCQAMIKPLLKVMMISERSWRVRTKVESSCLKVENQSENEKLKFKLELLERTTLTGERLKGNDNLLKFYTGNKLNSLLLLLLCL